MFIQIKNAEELLQKLGKIPGSQTSHGEASFGYSFELKDGSKLIIGQTDKDVSEEHLFWIQLINKPVETTKEQPMFRLMYPVIDSDRDPIKDRNEQVMLFTLEDAISFRKANDLSNVHEEAFYWIRTDKEGSENLKHCYIELAE